jgi:hypothetical protein
VAEVSTIMEEKNKLEAKLCVLESGKGKATKSVRISEPAKADGPPAPRPLVAAAKFTAPPLPAEERSSTGRNLRRSSRSASAVASVLLNTMEEMKEQKESGKPQQATPDKTPAEKKVKVKTSVSQSPAKAVRTKDREVLAPVTNRWIVAPHHRLTLALPARGKPC